MPTTPRPDSRTRFVELLRDNILKLDLAAKLDFGIYRILNYRQQEIDDYLNKRLAPRIDAVLSRKAGDALAAAQTKRDDLLLLVKAKADEEEVTAGAFLADGTLNPAMTAFKVGRDYEQAEAEVRKLQAATVVGNSEESNLYNTLYNFFTRYYADGDFMPQPRRSRTTHYSVAYSGEDVHFHWRSRGSHYIKSSENLSAYAFRVGSLRVSFELRRADVEQNNVKGRTRYFFPLVKEVQTDAAAGTLVIPFEFRPATAAEEKLYARKNGNGAVSEVETEETNGNGNSNGGVNGNGKIDQNKLLEAAVDEMQKRGKLADLDRNLLLNNLRRFAQKQRSDYFVHPHLGAFLRGELDYYLKDVFFDLSGLTSAEQLARRYEQYTALRDIGHEIIGLLERIEQVQARLFEKRKFVLATDWLIPLRQIATEHHPRLLELAAQRQPDQPETQAEAWQRLFAVQVDASNIAQQPTLVVNSRYFPADFTALLLAGYDDLDAATDGLLIHAENYAALQTLSAGMAGKVKVIYIDPPYNTGNDDFIYKDDFDRHSTWLTMMEERLLLARDLLTDDGVIFVSIDDNEQSRLKELMDLVFGVENFVGSIVWKKKTNGNNMGYIPPVHEVILAYARVAEQCKLYDLALSEEYIARSYSNPDNDPRGVWTTTDLSANHVGPYFPIKNPKTEVDYYPPNGRYWVFSKEEVDRRVQDGRIIFGRRGVTAPVQKKFKNEAVLSVRAESWWDSETFYNEVGTEEIKHLLEAKAFDNPKSSKLIGQLLRISSVDRDSALDFFAGSGTTGHAVINLNREDGGQRRFVLVEQGRHFETVLLPRIQKVMYSPAWKDGQPQPGGMLPQPEWVERSPRLVKVLRLESYEQSLNALVTSPAEGQIALPPEPDLLRYLLPPDEEATLPAAGRPSVRPTVLLNPAALERPFDYRLPGGEADGKPVDLVTSFNLLRGLHVRRQYAVQAGGRRYLLVDALEADAPVLVVWRDLHEPPYDPTAERHDFAAAMAAAGLDVAAYTTVYHNADMVPDVARDTTIRLRSVDDLFQQAIDPATRPSSEEES